MTTLVGIAGGSGSGKTTLAREIHRQARPQEVALIAIDSFYHSLQPDQQPEEINYDHPASLDFDLLQECLGQLVSGQAVDVPTYDFATHRRTGAMRQRPAPLIVVEGILTLAHEGVRDRLHLSVFVQAPDAIRFERRLVRDTSARGRTDASVREQWSRTVEPMHAQFVEPTRNHADVVVDGTACVHAAAGDILARSRQRRG